MNNSVAHFGTLFVRQPDTQFNSFDDLYSAVNSEMEASKTHWIPPSNLYATVHQDRLKLKITGDRAYDLNDWSFSQLCSYLNADRKVMDRLAAETAAQVVSEIFPTGGTPLQIYTVGSTIRSIHPISYSRLSSTDVLEMVIDEACNLTEYRDLSLKIPGYFNGERDMFSCLIDDSSWLVCRDERFAPALVVWNSEVGNRSVGMRSAWYHADTKGFFIVDDDDPIGYARRHSFGVRESLSIMRGRIHLWQASLDSRIENFLSCLTESANAMYSDSYEEMKRQLMRSGLRTEQVKAVDKWLTTTDRKRSRLNVAIACLSVVQDAKIASNRFDAGRVACSIVSGRFTAALSVCM